MMKITHLLYRSYTHLHFNPKQVERIFEVSRKNNERDMITGILLYRAKMFMQLLEGNETEVMKCFNRIRTDSRHFGAGIILKLDSDRRLFPKWSMAHIPDEKPLRAFTNIEAVTMATSSQGQPNLATMLNIIKIFADPGQLLAQDRDKDKDAA